MLLLLIYFLSFRSDSWGPKVTWKAGDIYFASFWKLVKRPSTELLKPFSALFFDKIASIKTLIFNIYDFQFVLEKSKLEINWLLYCTFDFRATLVYIKKTAQLLHWLFHNKNYELSEHRLHFQTPNNFRTRNYFVFLIRNFEGSVKSFRTIPLHTPFFFYRRILKKYNQFLTQNIFKKVLLSFVCKS